MATQEMVMVHQAIVDDRVVDLLWDIYERAFRDGECAQVQQCYTREQLREALGGGEHVTFVATRGDVEQGFLLGTRDLELARVAYADPTFFRTRYPEFAAQRRLFYVTAIAVEPDSQGLRTGFNLMKALVQWAWNAEVVVAYDFSSNKHPRFAEICQRALHTQVVRDHGGHAVCEVLDRQVYMVTYWSERPPR